MMAFPQCPALVAPTKIGGAGGVRAFLPCAAVAFLRLVAIIWCCGLAGLGPAVAQQPPSAWSTDLDPSVKPEDAAPLKPPVTTPAGEGAGTTVVKKKAKESAVAGNTSKVRLVALLTADGQKIEQDIVWRVFEPASQPGGPGKLISTHETASPVLNLNPGTYSINAAFGRAHLTRQIKVAAGVETTEPFVLNAGGLRVRIAPTQAKIDLTKAAFDILSDERDQRGDRATIMSRAKPNVVIRLNSGIYHIVSTLGDANATVEADVTVEAGKLTEASVTHQAGRVTLKLVTRQGGEALPDTEWSVLTEHGQTVKTSVGALPTHILAPGKYLAVARSQGIVFRRNFSVADGEAIDVEVLKQ